MVYGRVEVAGDVGSPAPPVRAYLRDEPAPQVTGPPNDAPEQAPAAVRDTRAELAKEFLLGNGIEVGALHLRMTLPGNSTVRYVDRMTLSELREHYPELAGVDLAPVDVVDDGELLPTIDAESVDFIVANHFLEHCEDPIRTIETHLGKLKPGGILFYAVPDKRYAFDFRRPRTPLSHLISDHENGPEGSRSGHYLEWTQLVYEGSAPPEEAAARRHAEQLEAEGYSIHFHAWTQTDLLALMLHCRQRLSSFEIEAVRRRSLETIVVLRKHGEAVVQVSLATGAAPSSPCPRAAPPMYHVPAQLMNLGQRIYLTYRYRGLKSVIYRAATFPLRFTPLERFLGL